MNANTILNQPDARIGHRLGTWHILLLLGFLVTSLLTAACRDDAIPNDEDPRLNLGDYSDFTGVWEGTLFEATSGNFGEVILTAHQAGGTVTGTWTAIYPTVVNGGTMAGSAVQGNTIHLILSPSNTYFCPIDITVYVEFGTHALGNYASINCGYLQTGVIETWRNYMGGGYQPDPPDTPANLQLTPGAGEVTLKWAHVTNASGYHIYYDTAPFTDLSLAMKVERVTSPFTLSGLSNGVTHHFVVVASNMGGESPPTPALTATPQALGP